MNAQRSRRLLGWLLMTGSLLTVSLGAGAGAAVAAQRSVARPEALAGGGTIKVCQCTNGMAADPNTDTLWLANGLTKKVSVISERTLKVVATISMGPALSSSGVGELVVDPVSRTVWDFAGAYLVRISDKTMKMRVLQPSGYQDGFAGVVDPVRGEIWAMTQETIQGISEATGKVLSTQFLANSFQLDTYSGLGVDPKTGSVFVAVNKFSSTRTWLYDVDEASGTATVIRKLAGPSYGLVVDPAAGTVWDLRHGRLSEFGATGQHKALGSIPISSSRFGPMAEDAATGTIWMGASNGDLLTRYSESHRAVARTLPLPGPSNGIALDTRSHTVFALNLHNHVVRFYHY